MTTQDDVDQNLATLRLATQQLAQHATQAPELVKADAYHILSAFNQMAFVVMALGLVSGAPPHTTYKVGKVA